MFNSILAGEADNQIFMYVLMGVLIVAVIAMFVFSARRNKKRQQEAEQLINSVKPGNKVKTIGGVCGIVVEVNDEENTFVLETGSEASGKCYMKFDRQAIYQTDAVVTPADKAADKTEQVEEQPAEEPAQTAEEVKEEPAQAVAEEKVEEAKQPSEKPARAKKGSKKSSDAE